VVDLPNELSASERSDRDGTFCIGPGRLFPPSTPLEGADPEGEQLPDALDCTKRD